VTAQGPLEVAVAVAVAVGVRVGVFVAAPGVLVIVGLLVMVGVLVGAPGVGLLVGVFVFKGVFVGPGGVVGVTAMGLVHPFTMAKTPTMRTESRAPPAKNFPCGVLLIFTSSLR